MGYLHKLKQKDAAELLGVAPRTLRDWDASADPPPRNEDGSYSGPALVAWFTADGGAGDFDSQRERLAAAQAEKVETENAIRRGQLLFAEDAERLWTDLILAARSRLLAMPGKLAPTLADLSDPGAIATAIRVEVYAALTELSRCERPVRGDARAS
jgi:phage terminase Nu1 subunit (DNA packaging protein)